jgi:hypothetical protein
MPRFSAKQTRNFEEPFLNITTWRNQSLISSHLKDLRMKYKWLSQCITIYTKYIFHFFLSKIYILLYNIMQTWHI